MDPMEELRDLLINYLRRAESADRILRTLSNCRALGFTAGVGVGGAVFKDATKSPDHRLSALVSLLGFATGFAVGYLGCKNLRNRLEGVVTQANAKKKHRPQQRSTECAT